MNHMNIKELLGVEKALIGMVHLSPLPGSPRWAGSMEAVIGRAVEDARAIETGGFHAILVENQGDAPFSPGSVDPGAVAAMAVVVSEIKRAIGLPVGVNVLKNDAKA